MNYVHSNVVKDGDLVVFNDNSNPSDKWVIDSVCIVCVPIGTSIQLIKLCLKGVVLMSNHDS